MMLTRAVNFLYAFLELYSSVIMTIGRNAFVLMLVCFP